MAEPFPGLESFQSFQTPKLGEALNCSPPCIFMITVIRCHLLDDMWIALDWVQLIPQLLCELGGTAALIAAGCVVGRHRLALVVPEHTHKQAGWGHMQTAALILTVFMPCWTLMSKALKACISSAISPACTTAAYPVTCHAQGGCTRKVRKVEAASADSLLGPVAALNHAWFCWLLCLSALLALTKVLALSM